MWLLFDLPFFSINFPYKNFNSSTFSVPFNSTSLLPVYFDDIEYLPLYDEFLGKINESFPHRISNEILFRTIFREKKIHVKISCSKRFVAKIAYMTKGMYYVRTSYL